MNKNQTNKKLLELGVEGGSISIYQFFDEKGNDWYFHKTNEMNWEDLGLDIETKLLKLHQFL